MLGLDLPLHLAVVDRSDEKSVLRQEILILRVVALNRFNPVLKWLHWIQILERPIFRIALTCTVHLISLNFYYLLGLWTSMHHNATTSSERSLIPVSNTY